MNTILQILDYVTGGVAVFLFMVIAVGRVGFVAKIRAVRYMAGIASNGPSDSAANQQ
jgi:hypothetical protein